MKLSKETVAVLKNFSTINNNLLIKEGSKLTTLSAAKSVFATAQVAETFPSNFGIYDLPEFLGALNLFEDPEIDFSDKFVKISQGRNSVKYYGADESVLTVPTKELKLPPMDVEFKLTAEQIAMIHRTSGVLGTSDVTIVGDGKVLTVIVGDKKNSTGNKYETEVGTTDESFSAHLRIDNMKFMPNDYTVELSSKRIAKFSTKGLEYVVSLEADSTFA